MTWQATSILSAGLVLTALILLAAAALDAPGRFELAREIRLWRVLVEAGR